MSQFVFRVFPLYRLRYRTRCFVSRQKAFKQSSARRLNTLQSQSFFFFFVCCQSERGGNTTLNVTCHSFFCNFALSSPQPFLRTYKGLFIIASALFLSSVSAQSTDPTAIGAFRAKNFFCLLLWGSHSKPTWSLLIVLLCMKFLFTPSPHIYPVLSLSYFSVSFIFIPLFVFLLLLLLSLFLFVSSTGYVFHYYPHL